MVAPMGDRFVPPTVMQRGAIVRATAAAMHAASQALARGEQQGRLTCSRCGGSIRWSGSGSRSAGSCNSSTCGVRWAMQ